MSPPIQIMPLSRRLDEHTRALGVASLDKRELPKIGGSAGGFIAVIVCLILIIIVSCTAVFFLLRNHPDGDTEANRRQRSRYHDKAGPTSSYTYKASSSTSDSWSKKLTAMLGIGGTKNKNRTRESSGQGGWTRTGSGDEWDSDSGDEGPRQTREVAREMEGGGNPIIYSRDATPLDSPFQPPVATFDSYNTSQPRDSLDSHSTLPRIHTQLSPSLDTSPSIRLIRTTSPERLPNSITIDASDANGREFSTQSGTSMRTLGGGTKFIESL